MSDEDRTDRPGWRSRLPGLLGGSRGAADFDVDVPEETGETSTIGADVLQQLFEERPELIADLTDGAVDMMTREGHRIDIHDQETGKRIDSIDIAGIGREAYLATLPDQIRSELHKRSQNQNSGDYFNWTTPLDMKIDTLVRRASSMSSEMDLDDLFEVCEIFYREHSMVAAITDGTVDSLLMGDEDGKIGKIRGPDIKIAELAFFLAQRMGIETKMSLLFRDMGIFGNSIFLLKFAEKDDPDFDIVKGEIINIHPTRFRSWSTRVTGTPNSRVYHKKGGTKLNVAMEAVKQGFIDITDVLPENGVSPEAGVPADKLMHFALDLISGEVWAIPYWRRVLRELQGIRNAHQDIATILKSYISPTRICKINTNPATGGRPYDKKTRALLIELLSGFAPNRVGIILDWMELTVLESESRSVNIELYNKLENVILAVTGYPRHTYLDVGNRSVSDNITSKFKQRQRFMWQEATNQLNMNLIWPLVRQAARILGKELSEQDEMRYSWVFLTPLEAASEQLRKAQAAQILAAGRIIDPKTLAVEWFGVAPEEYDRMWSEFDAMAPTDPSSTEIAPEPSDGPDEADPMGDDADASDDDPAKVDDALESGEISKDPRVIVESELSREELENIRRVAKDGWWRLYAKGTLDPSLDSLVKEAEKEDSGE